MRHTARSIITTVLSLATLLGAMLLIPFQVSAAGATIAEQGKAVAFNRKKGNCLACHAMDDGTLPGNIGPPLVGMKARYPDKAKLRAQIWDSTVANPNTIMPPFGRNRILSDDEIDQITEYVYTL